MKYYLYILFSETLNKYYIGYTANIDMRLKEHLYNHKGFTAKAKDWVVVHQESFRSKNDAMMRETQIKKKKSRKYIEFLIQSKDNYTV